MAKTSSEFNWRVVAQRAVGSYPVVALSPALDLLPGILHAEKPVLIEALFPEPSIERLDVGVVDRFAWPTEVELDPIEVRPLVDDLRRELATVVAADGCRLYEQGATETRLWQYVSRWTRWLWGGLDGLVSRKGGIRRYYFGVIKRLRIRGLYRPIQSCPGYKTGLPAPLL